MEVETKGEDPNSRSVDSELKLGGNIVLTGFSLDPAEMIVVKKIVGHYAKKISEAADYTELKIRLKQSKKAQAFLHQLDVNVALNKGMIASSIEDKNLYSGLSAALEKVYNQILHKE